MIVSNIGIRSLLVAILLSGSIAAFARPKDSVAVMQAAEKFVNAFNHFKWQPFSESFTDDASIFFPEWDPVRRVTGRRDIENAWVSLFPEFLNNPDSFKLEISPKDTRIQLLGNIAVMTFHLGDGQSRLARRTIVWVKRKREWKIAHLHASFMKKPD